MTGPDELAGRWVLARRVADRRAGVQGTVVGELVVAPDGGGFRWAESGVLRWGGVSRPVHRTYLFREGPDGWHVHFEDGRPFHPWTPGIAVTHPCRSDVYTGLVTVDGDRMRTLWDVRGPAREQRLVTRLSRRPAGATGAPSGSRRRGG